MTKATHGMSDYEARAWRALNEHWAPPTPDRFAHPRSRRAGEVGVRGRAAGARVA